MEKSKQNVIQKAIELHKTCKLSVYYPYYFIYWVSWTDTDVFGSVHIIKTFSTVLKIFYAGIEYFFSFHNLMPMLTNLNGNEFVYVKIEFLHL